ncbi:MAG: hypothetical protein Q9P14_00105 [candidate division KSB1 bacterium]|nr:hypothetical protein [candidate division KSB1 bacterium]
MAIQEFAACMVLITKSGADSQKFISQIGSNAFNRIRTPTSRDEVIGIDEKIWATLHIVRPHNCLISGLSIWIAAFLARPIQSPAAVGFAILSGMLLTAWRQCD